MSGGNGGQKAIVPTAPKAPALALGDAGVSFSSFAELWDWSQGVARSALIPDAYRGKPHDIMVAVQMGMEVGLRPMTALQNIGVINGKPGLYGEIILGMIRGAGVMDESAFAESFERDRDGNVVAAVSTMARVGGAPRTERFSVEDAKQAGLWMSGVGWKKYPRDMLLWKARHRNEKALFSDVTHGLVPRELLEGDQPERTVEQIERPSGLDDMVRQYREELAEPIDVEAEPIDDYDPETGEVIEERADDSERQPGEEG